MFFFFFFAVLAGIVCSAHNIMIILYVAFHKCRTSRLLFSAALLGFANLNEFLFLCTRRHDSTKKILKRSEKRPTIQLCNRKLKTTCSTASSCEQKDFYYSFAFRYFRFFILCSFLLNIFALLCLVLSQLQTVANNRQKKREFNEIYLRFHTREKKNARTEHAANHATHNRQFHGSCDCCDATPAPFESKET